MIFIMIITLILCTFIMFWLLIFGGTAKKYKKSGFVDGDLPCETCRHCDNCLHQGDLVRTNKVLKDLNKSEIINVKLNCVLYDEIYSSVDEI